MKRKDEMKFSITISAENRRGTTITWLEHTGQMPQRSCRNICKRCTAICSGKQVLTRCTVQTRERGNRSCPNNKNQLSHYSWRGDSAPTRDSHRYRPVYPVPSSYDESIPLCRLCAQ